MIRKTAFVLFLGLYVFAAPTIAAAKSASSQRIVVHLTKDTGDLHAPFMALKLATVLRKQGAKVTVFVDLEGVRLADSRTPDGLRWGQSDKTLDDLYRGFVKAGGQVVVCPHCAKAQGLTADLLRPGAKIASAEELGELFLGADKILDY